MSIRTVEGPCTAAYNPGSRTLIMTMNPALSAFNHVVAFEVAKDSLVVYVLPTEKQSIAANEPTAIRKALIAEMRRNAEASLGPLLVVCEATGGYERHVLEVCE